MLGAARACIDRYHASSSVQPGLHRTLCRQKNGLLPTSQGALATGSGTALAPTAQLPGLRCTWQRPSSSRLMVVHDRAAAALTLCLVCRWQMREG